jgi:hypothetical protein
MNNQFIIPQVFAFNKREYSDKKAAIQTDSGFGWFRD